LMSTLGNNKATLMDGSALAAKILDEVKKEIHMNNYDIRLAAIIVGDDRGSFTYQQMKEKKCVEVGIRYSLYAYPNPPDPSDVKNKIIKLNNNKDITGIMVQLPLPMDYNENELLEVIASEKDVDGLNFMNVGRSYYSSNVFVPCAAEGIIRMLKEYNVNISGKKAVILGRGRLLGTPIAQLLEKENAFVTKIHSVVEKDDIRRELSSADLIISATGQPQLIDASFLKDNVVTIDCANTRQDREFSDDVFEKTSFFATVPGGVGPMTIAVLINNTLRAYKQSIGA
ncbi:MAG: bifunctional 5,10-methylenetetrahydrofolate dehydrogenase/5,10-methenyltetrahydrofolate cyclohydrolase, partial [Candidatus Hermodarchaeota archaeon]